MKLSEAIRYYSRKDVVQELLRLAQGREVAVSFQGQGYGKRPDTLEMPGDVEKLVRQGATSFHCSEELWSDAMQLDPGLTKKQLEALRTGFDLVLDIDSPNIEYGKVTAKLLIEAMKYHGIKAPSLKFSGNKGLHIGVPFKALPKQVHGQPIEQLFPEVPRAIAEYLKEFIKPHLSDAILNIKSLKQIMSDTHKKREDLIKEGELDPYAVLEVDTILISSRHLFRMPYSINEKSGLVSVTININELESFDRDLAKPDLVKEVNPSFLDPDLFEEGEASQLVVQASDWKIRVEKKEAEKRVIRPEDVFTDKITEENFPPCIKAILSGVDEGKRGTSLFILFGFLRGANWGWKEIEDRVRAWNEKGNPPLKEGYIKSQVVWHRQQDRKLPPNCSQQTYYKNLGLCRADVLCSRVKNPVTYAVRRARRK